MAITYEIIGQRPITEINESGRLVENQEITFTWGNDFIGRIRVNPKSITPEIIARLITEYIAKLTPNG